MAVWKLKGCPRCGGDLFLVKDLDAWEEQCLQCSFSRELKRISRFSERAAVETEEEKEPVPVHSERGRNRRSSS